MKKLLLSVLLLMPVFIFAQTGPATGARAVLLEQLKTTHNKKEWFVPVNDAVAGLTAQQAAWKDSSGNHSVAQLVNHLAFWNGQQLAKFKGEKPAAFSGNNDETFDNKIDEQSWKAAIQKLDNILSQLENLVATAPESKLASWSSTIANISTHNAYHTGQIIFVRKLQGNWDPEKGVKF